jgi:hypothetical protein
MKNTILIALALLCAAGGRAAAGVIEVLPTGGGHTLHLHSPLGQTFTAEDPLVVIGLHIFPHPLAGSDRSVVMELFAGEGVGTPPLDSRMITPPVGFVGYLDADFSNVALVPGNKYSITLSAASEAWISSSSLDSSDAYGGGVTILTGDLRPDLGDKAFHVLPVPEPGGLALWSIATAGAALCAACRKLRKPALG